MTKRARGTDAEVSLPPEERDAVSWLQRHAHAMRWELPAYSEVERSGEAHEPTFVFRVVVGPVSATASGTNKKVAKQNVARAAMLLAKADGLVPAEKVAKIKSHSQSLYELVQRQGWTLEYPWAQPSPQDFVCAAVINGRVVAEERGVTRRMARENASQRANQTLCPEPTRQPFAREIVRMAMAHFSALTEHIRIAASTCVACFVLESSDGLRVVAMGSGTGYYADEFAPQDPSAELVVDGHAEVLARRSLLRFLYHELEQLQRGQPSIFELAAAKNNPASPKNGLYSLQPDVSLHLYISVLPCGDAKMVAAAGSAGGSNCDHIQGAGAGVGGAFLRPLRAIHSHNGCGHPLPSAQDLNAHWPTTGRKCEGVLRARLDTGESYSPLPPPPAGQRGVSGSGGDDGAGGAEAITSRIRKVSCSDKILGWNVLGLQGSLLASLLTAPIYLRSITVGGKSFSHGAVSRALCCRAAPMATRLNAPYSLNHPALFYVGDEEVPGQQEPAGHGGHKLSALAWCWSHGDPFPELLDCRSGRPVHAMQFAGITKTAEEAGATKAVAAAATEEQEAEAAAASKDGNEKEVEKVEQKELTEVQDAVSELNHCAQMNAWPVAIYRDISPPRPAPPRDYYAGASPAAALAVGYPFRDGAVGIAGPETARVALLASTPAQVMPAQGEFQGKSTAFDPPTFSDPLYSSECSSDSLNGSAYGATSISDLYGQGGQVYGNTPAGFSGHTPLPGHDAFGGMPQTHCSAIAPPPPMPPPPPGFRLGQPPPITGLSFVPQTLTGSGASGARSSSACIASSTSPGNSSSIHGGRMIPTSAARVFSVEVTCDVRGQVFTAQGHAKSKKQAKQAAAKAMLDQLVSSMGPVVARPTSVVAGASLFARYQALVANSLATTTNVQENGNNTNDKDNNNGSKLNNGSNLNDSYDDNNCNNSNGHHTGNADHQALTTLTADTIRVSSNVPAMAPSLSYWQAKAGSEHYRAVKQALHAFYATSRSSGGMGQQWLSRRLPASQVLGYCGLSAAQTSSSAAADVYAAAAAAATAAGTAVAAAPQDATTSNTALAPPAMPAGLSFTASAVDRDEDYSK